MRSDGADLRVERACRLLAWVGCVWFAFTAWWGFASIPAGGHIGAGAAGTTMLAESALHWKTIYPLFDWYAVTDPYPQAAYCHHPFGMYWLCEVMLRIFGHKNFVPGLSAVIMSTLTPPLLYKTARAAWGPVAGVAAVLGFVTIPIDVGFSNFHNLEVMTMFGITLFFFGHTRYERTRRRRDLAWSLVGALFATSGDWVGFLVMAPLLGFAFMRAFVLPPWATPPIDFRRYAKWWALSVATAVGMAVLWIVLFKHVDKLSDWLSSAESRGGADIPLAKVLEARKTWIDFSFTPLVIAIGKLAFPVALIRLIVVRRDEEAYSLAVLVGATFQYLAFKRGADIHIFWPHYFGLYYAFAFAQFVTSADAFFRYVVRHIQPTRSAVAGTIAGFVVMLVPVSLVAPDGVRALKIWRETGGKYNDNGTLLRAHVDMLVVVQSLLAGHVAVGERVGVHGGANWGWEHQWSLRGQNDQAENPSGANPFWIARASGLGADHLLDLARKFHLRIYGDTVLVTRGEPNAPLDAYSLNEHEPNPFQWMFTNNTEPVREIGNAPDELATWEWRHHLSQPAPFPSREPSTLDEVRIAHNVAAARGDVATRDRLLDRIRKELVRDPETHFDGDHELMGVRVRGGVKPTLEVWFMAGGPTSNDTTFAVRSSVVKKNPLSLVPVDTVDREMAWPPALSSKLWKAGYIYTFEVVLNHRIGLERYSGHWRGGPPAKKRGDAPIDLVYLP